MEICYPIFVKDQDGWVSILNRFEDLQVKLEKIDIEDKEYTTWDAEGLPVELYLDQKEMKVKALSDENRQDELKEAILNYAKLARPKVPFFYSGTEKSMVELFEAVEKHIKNGRFVQKVKRLFHK
jgi:hypothetical protein